MGSLMVLIFVARFAENRGRLQALLPATLFVDTRIGESGLESNRRALPDPFHRRCAAELSALRGTDLTVDARTNSRIRAPWFTPGTEIARSRFERGMQQATGLGAKGLTRMSPILPISFLVTLLCAFGWGKGVLFQQFMFVGAALSATILACSFEAWSAREIPVRSDDETWLRNHSDH